MTAHLDRTIAAMDAADVDLLILGREANARFVSDANRLWLAGTRSFAPGCAVVRSTGAVHLLSITDDGIPSTIPAANLYPISWNPMNLLDAVAAAPGARSARRIGVDEMTPLFESLIQVTFVGAELVDAEAMLRELRRVKTDDDIAGLRSAAGVASDAMQAVTAAFSGGAEPIQLAGLFLEHMAASGVTTPSFTPSVEATDAGHVVVRAGAIRAGWEAVLARTMPFDDVVAAAARDLIGACRSGVRVGDVRALGTTVDGVGLGHEELADADTLAAGMTLSVEARVADAAHGDTIVVGDESAEVLTSVG